MKAGTITERWGWFAELYGRFELDADSFDQHSVQAGATVLLANNFQLDARAGASLMNDVPTWLTGFGLGWRLPR